MENQRNLIDRIKFKLIKEKLIITNLLPKHQVNIHHTFNQNRKKFIYIFIMLFLFSFAVSIAVYLSNQIKISKILTSEIHNFVLSEDLTQVRNYILPLIPSVFSKVKIVDGVKTKFEASDNEQPLFSMTIKQNISSSKNNPNSGYTVLFYFSLHTMLYLSLIMTAVAFFLTIPFIYFEQKENELRKQESLTLMSRKLAHDIRSPLSTLNLVSSRIENPDLKYLQNGVINQINMLAENLLGHTKRNNQISYFDLLTQIKNEYEIKSKQIYQQIIFEVHSNLNAVTKPAPLFLYAGIINIVQNAIEASPADSKIQICAELVGSYIKIQVIDAGHGIPDYLLKVIGTKEITSKNASGFSGNGFALFNLNHEVLKINGKLIIDSAVDKGTSVTLQMPL